MYKKAKRSWINIKTSPPSIDKTKIKKEIKKESKTKKGLTDIKIVSFLRNFPHFLGCFAEDELKSLYVRSLPVSLIINCDHSGLDGSHWIAIRIEKKRLEIFDPLGFNVKRWPRIPYFMLDFLHKFSVHRKVYVSREIQPINSTLCGFYCIFFLYYRTFNSFFNCTKPFSLKLCKNDLILFNLFNKF